MKHTIHWISESLVPPRTLSRRARDSLFGNITCHYSTFRCFVQICCHGPMGHSRQLFSKCVVNRRRLTRSGRRDLRLGLLHDSYRLICTHLAFAPVPFVCVLLSIFIDTCSPSPECRYARARRGPCHSHANIQTNNERVVFYKVSHFNKFHSAHNAHPYPCHLIVYLFRFCSLIFLRLLLLLLLCRFSLLLCAATRAGPGSPPEKIISIKILNLAIKLFRARIWKPSGCRNDLSLSASLHSTMMMMTTMTTTRTNERNQMKSVKIYGTNLFKFFSHSFWLNFILLCSVPCFHSRFIHFCHFFSFVSVFVPSFLFSRAAFPYYSVLFGPFQQLVRLFFTCFVAGCHAKIVQLLHR